MKVKAKIRKVFLDSLFVGLLVWLVVGLAAQPGFRQAQSAAATQTTVERFLVEPLRRGGSGLPSEGLFYLSTGLFLQDGEETDGYGYFLVPEGANCWLTVSAVVVPGRSDEIYIIGNAAWGGIGEVYNTHKINGDPTTVYVVEDRYNAVLEMMIGEVVSGDIVLLEFARYGGAVEDQLGKWAYLVGWMVEIEDCGLRIGD